MREGETPHLPSKALERRRLCCLEPPRIQLWHTIGHGVPVFLDQLVDALRRGVGSSAEIGRSAVLRGHDLLLQGFTVSQVVHDYGDVCQAVTELAVQMNAPIARKTFRRSTAAWTTPSPVPSPGTWACQEAPGRCSIAAS
jgi:hypothetical protein